MRRIVDTLILLLVAHTVSWPLIRGFVGTEGTVRPVRVEVRGLDDHEATIHIARDEADANQQQWAAVAECRQDDDAPVVSWIGDRDRVWIVVRMDGVVLPPYALMIDRTSEPARLVVDLPFTDTSSTSTEPK